MIRIRKAQLDSKVLSLALPLGYHLGSIEDELREDLWCLDSYAESKQAGGWANRLLLDYEGIESDLPMRT